MWTKEQISDHVKAAKNLTDIKDLAFQHIRENNDISEYELQQFIMKKIKEFKMISDKDAPIVAFRENTGIVHYFPNKDSKKLKAESLILIDIWAKLNKENAPFADITWMGYKGNNFGDMEKIFNIVIKARDLCIEFIESKLRNNKDVIGEEADAVCRDIISKQGYEKEFKHTTGHSLGITEVHGPEKNRLAKNSNQPLSKNMGYTIEPGIYLKNRFGVRSEIDFYISENNKLIITTDMQKEIVKI